MNDDLPHVLRAIIRVLDDEIQWPDAEERHQLATQSNGIFANIIGIVDCTEHVIQKPTDRLHEHQTYSGKQDDNTLKTIAIIDKNGYFRYVATGFDGGRNDREVWTSLELVQLPGKYFSEGERVAGDGIFQGQGPNFVSYRTIKDDHARGFFNAVFNRMRSAVETAFGRVQRWFSILGNKKKYWNYSEDLLDLAVHASTRLHNWMLRQRRLNYNPLLDGNALAPYM